MTQEEKCELESIFAEIIDPVKCYSCQENLTSIIEKHICLTGDFDFGSKSDVKELIQQAGGIIDKNVNKTTDILVVGAQGSNAWKAGNYGEKIQKAIAWNEKGQSIKIIEEKCFIPSVQNILNSHNECACSENISKMNNWRTAAQSMLDRFVLEEELPEGSFTIIDNYDRENKKITSYSVCIYEPNYPLMPNSENNMSKCSIILNIIESVSSLELAVDKKCYEKISAPVNSRIKEGNIIHIILPKESQEVIDYIYSVSKYAYENYSSRATSFGCCDQFIDCSNAKKCLHVNKLYSKACSYRNNLENGRIFYGENKNIHQAKNANE